MAGLLEGGAIPPLESMDIENTSLHELHKPAAKIRTTAGLSQTIIDSNETSSYYPTGSKIPDTFRTQLSFSENSPHICSGSVLQSSNVGTFDSSLKTTYSIETSSALESVLEHQTQLQEGLSSLTESAGVTTNPDRLRFDYPLDDGDESVKTKTRKPPPTVYREQDRFVPINNVGRSMRNSVPRTAKISKDAKQCMQECVSEFISFLTSEASDRCIDEKRKTITGDDILFALSTLGFDNYVDPLQMYLQKYRGFVHFDKPSNKDDGGDITSMQSFYPD